jgi:RNA polymerase sigma-70 factor (ECF subfamily)
MPTDRTAQIQAQLETLLPAEWERLVRLCASISGSADAAEDLAQETMIEAWRSAGRLRDLDTQRAWLAGIARNVCRRWARGQGRDAARRERLLRSASAEDMVEEPGDLALERNELGALLDRALDHLPEPTRDVMVLRYLDERTHAEIAGRLGLSEGAVMVRAHRGRQALKRALASPDLRADAAPFGLAIPAGDNNWTVTRIWCPFCGRHRLKTRIDADSGTLFTTCSGACLDSGVIIGGTTMHSDTRSLTSLKSIVARELVHLNDFYRMALRDGGSRCVICGRFVALDQWHPDRPSPTPTAHLHGVRMHCTHCDSESSASLWHLLIDTPEAQRFWRRHPRIAGLPVREIECDGRPALVSGFTSVDLAARLEVVCARDTFDILYVEGLPDR